MHLQGRQSTCCVALWSCPAQTKNKQLSQVLLPEHLSNIVRTLIKDHTHTHTHTHTQRIYIYTFETHRHTHTHKISDPYITYTHTLFLTDTYRGFPTRMVYLYYISCLRYTILVGNPRYALMSAGTHRHTHTQAHTDTHTPWITFCSHIFQSFTTPSVSLFVWD